MKKKNLIYILSIFLLIQIVPIFAGELKVTTEHPFLINGNWIPASQLKVGDLLTTLDGKTAIIKSINSVNLADTFNVYNLEAGGRIMIIIMPCARICILLVRFIVGPKDQPVPDHTGRINARLGQHPLIAFINPVAVEFCQQIRLLADMGIQLVR